MRGPGFGQRAVAAPLELLWHTCDLLPIQNLMRHISVVHLADLSNSPSGDCLTGSRSTGHRGGVSLARRTCNHNPPRWHAVGFALPFQNSRQTGRQPQTGCPLRAASSLLCDAAPAALWPPRNSDCVWGLSRCDRIHSVVASDDHLDIHLLSLHLQWSCFLH